MEDYTIQQGETLRLTVTVDEEGAETAELVATSEDSTITSTATFDDMVADLTTNTPDDQATGDYEYYVRITWDDGSVDILTKREDCEDEECELPVITVCAISQEGS